MEVKTKYSPTGSDKWAPANTHMFKQGGKTKGSSNAGKYPASDGPFCGKAGGAKAGTYPIGTRKRGRSALKLAHNAPNPQGIKDCVHKNYPNLKDKKALGGALGKSKSKVTVQNKGEKPKSVEVESVGAGPARRRRPRNGTGPRAKAGLCRRSRFSKKCGGKV